MADTRSTYHGRVPVFFFVDPSETFSRDPEPYKLVRVYGSGVSEGSTEKKTGQGKSMNRGKIPIYKFFIDLPSIPGTNLSKARTLFVVQYNTMPAGNV